MMPINNLNTKVHRLGLLTILSFFLSMISHVSLAVTSMEDRLLRSAVDYGHLDSSLLIDISRVGNRLVAVGERGNVVYSDDAGTTWSLASVPVSSLLTAVYFVDDTFGWAVGHGGVILHSNDGGRTWEKQFDGNAANGMALEYLRGEYTALKQEYDQADEYDQEELEYELDDLAFMLEEAEIDKENGPSKPLLDVWFRNRTEGYVVGAYGFFFYTNDGGANWQYVADRLDNIDRYHLNAISALNSDTLMIVGEAGQMFASYDRGANWETLYGPYEGSLFGLQALNGSDSVIAYGLRGNAFKSDDAGSSWQKVELGIDTTLTASNLTSKGEVVLVGLSGVVLKSSDMGNSFVQLSDTSLDTYTGVTSNTNRELILVGEKGIKKFND